MSRLILHDQRKKVVHHRPYHEVNKQSHFPISPLAMRTPANLQPKLTVNPPGDRYEQEADRVAAQVMRMPEPKIQRLCPECEDNLQRQPMAEQEGKKEDETLQTNPLTESITPLIQRQTKPMEEEKKEEEETLQTKTAFGESPTVSPALQNQIIALQGGGQPLPASERHFFEPRFGTDFSQVRIHADNQAAEAARAVNARAFTLGRDVVFGAGEYQPSNLEGQRLLAHELTHVVQQSPRGMRRSLLDGGLERGTDAKASAANNRQIQIAIRSAAPVKIARQAPIDPRHARGYAGEQSMGFGYSAEKGWILIEGPGGSAGHGVTTRGFDGVAYNAKADELHLIDNKSLKAETARSATAITKNLQENLDALVNKVEGMRNMSKRIRILQLLKQMRDAVAAGRQLPKNTKLIVTGEGGQVKGVSTSLQKLGVEFREPGTTDLPPAKVPAPSPATPTAETKLPPSAKPPGESATPETPSSAKPSLEPTIPPAKASASPPATPTAETKLPPSAKPPRESVTPETTTTTTVSTGARVVAGGVGIIVVLNEILGGIGRVRGVDQQNIDMGNARIAFWERFGARPTPGVWDQNGQHPLPPGTVPSTSIFGSPSFPYVVDIDINALRENLPRRIDNYQDFLYFLDAGKSLDTIEEDPPMPAYSNREQRDISRRYFAWVNQPDRARRHSYDITQLILQVRTAALNELDVGMSEQTRALSPEQQRNTYRLKNGPETRIFRSAGGHQPILTSQQIFGPDPWIRPIGQQRDIGTFSTDMRILVVPANADAQRAALVSGYYVRQPIEDTYEEVRAGGRPILDRQPPKGRLNSFVAGPEPGSHSRFGQTRYYRHSDPNIQLQWTIALGELREFWVRRDDLEPVSDIDIAAFTRPR